MPWKSLRQPIQDCLQRAMVGQMTAPAVGIAFSEISAARDADAGRVPRAHQDAAFTVLRVASVTTISEHGLQGA